MLCPHAAVCCHPRRLPPLQGLLQLFAENGVAIPLHKCGPCQYRLGTAKLAVRLVNGRLMARAGGWAAMELLLRCLAACRIVHQRVD